MQKYPQLLEFSKKKSSVPQTSLDQRGSRWQTKKDGLNGHESDKPKEMVNVAQGMQFINAELVTHLKIEQQ